MNYITEYVRQGQRYIIIHNCIIASYHNTEKYTDMIPKVNIGIKVLCIM